MADNRNHNNDTLIRLILISCNILWLCISIHSQKITDKNIFLADPTIFHYGKMYYLYGTGGGNKDDGFKVFTSTDLKDWKDNGYVLKGGESYGTKGFWAPQVFYYDNKFYIIYTANEHIAIASANSPLGPFKQDSIKPVSSSVRMIDPFVFFDHGKIYLYHVRLDKGNRIFVAEMNKDMRTVKESTLHECIHADQPWEDKAGSKWKVTEGPTVQHYKQWYYLIYSANDFRNIHYAVGYAISKSPTGPWEKFTGNPMLSKANTGINGTGHGDIFVNEKDHQLYYVFHTHFSNEKVSPRKTAIIKLAFKNTPTFPQLTIIPSTFKYLSLQ